MKNFYINLNIIEWDNVLVCPSVIGTTQVIFFVGFFFFLH